MAGGNDRQQTAGGESEYPSHEQQTFDSLNNWATIIKTGVSRKRMREQDYSTDHHKKRSRSSSPTLPGKRADVPDFSFTNTQVFPHESKILSVVFSHDNNWLASGTEDGTIAIWTLTKDRRWEKNSTLKQDNAVIPISFNLHNTSLLAKSSNTYQRFVYEESKWINKVEKMECKGKCLASFPASNCFFTAEASNSEGVIKLYQLKDNKEKWKNKTSIHSCPKANKLQPSPDGKRLAVVHEQKTMSRYHSIENECLKIYECNTQGGWDLITEDKNCLPVGKIAFSPDGSSIVYSHDSSSSYDMESVNLYRTMSFNYDTDSNRWLHNSIFFSPEMVEDIIFIDSQSLVLVTASNLEFFSKLDINRWEKTDATFVQDVKTVTLLPQSAALLVSYSQPEPDQPKAHLLRLSSQKQWIKEYPLRCEKNIGFVHASPDGHWLTMTFAGENILYVQPIKCLPETPPGFKNNSLQPSQ